MPSMPALSREAEQKITSALGDVTDQVNAGTHPTAAIVKVATAQSIPAGHVRLMVNAYNIGRSEAQRKSSDDLLEKAGEFDLADTEDVLNQMFPDTVKTAGCRAEETVVSLQYQTPPSRLLSRGRRETMAKLASVNWKMVDAPPSLQRDVGAAARKIMREKWASQRQHDDLHRAADTLHRQTLGLLEKLADELRKPGSPSFAEVRDNCVSLHGDMAADVFAKLAGQHRILAKQASRKTLQPVDWSHKPYATFRDLIKSAEAFLQAKEAFDRFATQEAEKARASAPFVEATREGGAELAQSSADKSAGLMYGLMGSAIGSTLGREIASKGVKPIESLQTKARNSLNDPQQTAALRNIQTESMLSDLMANDEVISGYNPHDVISHFNEISQLSPRATNQSGLMRALLRKRLQQGALDPYEVDLLLKIENGLKQRDNPVPGSMGVMSNGPSGVM